MTLILSAFPGVGPVQVERDGHVAFIDPDHLARLQRRVESDTNVTGRVRVGRVVLDESDLASIRDYLTEPEPCATGTCAYDAVPPTAYCAGCDPYRDEDDR